MDSLEVNIGFESYERVSMAVTGWSTNEDFGGWWLDCEVNVFLGTFTARIDSEMLTSNELRVFYDSLENLYKTLKGTARLNSMDGWIDVELLGNGFGGIAVRGLVEDKRRNQLEFQFDIDQTFLPKMIQQTKFILEAVNK